MPQPLLYFNAVIYHFQFPASDVHPIPPPPPRSPPLIHLFPFLPNLVGRALIIKPVSPVFSLGAPPFFSPICGVVVLPLVFDYSGELDSSPPPPVGSAPVEDSSPLVEPFSPITPPSLPLFNADFRFVLSLIFFFFFFCFQPYLYPPPPPVSPELPTLPPIQWTLTSPIRYKGLPLGVLPPS